MGTGLWLRDHPWKHSYRPADRPLESFYIPALSRAVRYDRTAGFFSSSALAVAAAGVAKLVARGGTMRLLVGAKLAEQDVRALLAGESLEDQVSSAFLEALRQPNAFADLLVHRRLEMLAWLIAQGRLDVRVVVEADPYTRQPIASDGYFHAKGGVLWDEAGDGVAFSGSINETATAWRGNYESFHVFQSWQEAEHFQDEVDNFERLWADAEDGWVTVELPAAVREELVRMAPVEPPTEEPVLQPEAREDDRARWIAQYFRDAPYLVHKGWRVGVETAPVRPFPHQRAVAYDVLDRFPCDRLLADEVGLGKTIEAGLILRSLLLSGWVKRCLILVPRSLAKQWQEELRDRFWIQAPFYDGHQFIYYQDEGVVTERVPEGRSPWAVHPIVIASAQMAKRENRAAELTVADPWDLVIVDEAHHARRRDFLDLSRERPNRLLQFLRQLRRHDRARALLLMTATPMQVNPVEVWDLLRLLGLPPGWQDDQDAFLSYFGQLQLPFEEIEWGTVLRLMRQSIETWGWDGDWLRQAHTDLGPVSFGGVRSTIEHGGLREARRLQEKQRQWLRSAARAHNPVDRLIYRHTRALLRRYHAEGLMRERVPERDPQPLWMDMSEEEERLYHAVEDYISEYYKRYEEHRRGLGFVMTVYRRRLTSSLYALRESLARHRRVLLGDWQDRERPLGLDEEDSEEEDLDEDALESLEADLPASSAEEVREIDRLLAQIDRLGVEGKFTRLRDDLHQALERWDQVLVFTQYTDTMDFLRGQLQPVFGSRLACYSGRGGEVWEGDTGSWHGTSKERLQQRFAEGEIAVLLCTEAASEGLNLQNCGVLFNYDMPWNPMKVEQRIGRVDRIGQHRERVAIYHYFYRGTVEADVYARLGERIGWFETVVGKLQPILRHAQRAIRTAAMASREERKAILDQELDHLDSEAERRERETMPGEDWEEAPTVSARQPEAPVTHDSILRLKDGAEGSLAEVGAQALGDCEAGIATDRRNEVVMLYGPGLDEPLRSGSPPRGRPDILRLETADPRRIVGYYRHVGTGWQAVDTVAEIQAVPLESVIPAQAAGQEVRSLFDTDRQTSSTPFIRG